MLTIKVPATSANMGAGFDCLGVALDIYNYIEFEEIPNGIEINIPTGDNQIFRNQDQNLIFISFKKAAEKTGYRIKGLRINEKINIPVTRGLGSSASCIVAGILAANELGSIKMTNDQLIELATELDGHPDNVVPALMGGMTVACKESKSVSYVKMDFPENINFAVMIPDFQLSTTTARNLLPDKYIKQDAVHNVGRAALFVSSILCHKYSNLWTAVDDKMHQPYRKKLIPNFDEIVSKSKELGSLATYLSGAGPTVVSLINDKSNEFKKYMEDYCSSFKEKWNIYIVRPCAKGSEILYRK